MRYGAWPAVNTVPGCPRVVILYARSERRLHAAQYLHARDWARSDLCYLVLGAIVSGCIGKRTLRCVSCRSVIHN